MLIYDASANGNRFKIIDSRNADFIDGILFDTPANYPRGFDQLIVIETSKQLNIDAELKILNKDMSFATACGNGTRCAAYIAGNAEIGKDVTLKVEDRVLSCKIVGENQVSVDMGKPIWDKNKLPLSDKHEIENLCDFGAYTVFGKYPLPDSIHYCGIVNVGNPHIVFFIGEDIDRISYHMLENYFINIKNNTIFTDGMNLSFWNMSMGKNHRVFYNGVFYERGVGITSSCGTATCAAFAIANKIGICEEKADFYSLNHEKPITVSENKGNMIMTGPVNIQER